MHIHKFKLATLIIQIRQITKLIPPKIFLLYNNAYTEAVSLFYWLAITIITLSIVSTHRRILGMALVVCVSVKICASSISLYKLDPDKQTTPFESAHQFTLVCTVSDSKPVPGCHYNSCSKSQFCSD